MTTGEEFFLWLASIQIDPQMPGRRLKIEIGRKYSTTVL